MKKVLSVFAVMLLTVVLSLSNVDASDLTGQLKLSSSLGDNIKFDFSYDEETDMNHVLVTLLVDESSINNILGQRPGIGADLSLFYFGIDPKLSVAKTINEQVWVGESLTHKTFDSAMNTLKTKLDTGAVDDEQIVWGTTLTIQYSTDNGQTWKASTGAGNSSTTVGQNLLKNLGLTDASELEYGKNFRFSMYDYTFILGWNKLDEADQSLGKEYVVVEWEMEFPITGQKGEESIFFTTLEDALAAGSEYIDINKDVVVESDVVIPEGVVINVANGATLEIKEGNTFENKGKIYGDVRVDNVTKTYSSIIIMPIENGDVSVERISAASGELVTITSKAKEGYKLKKIVVIDLFNDKEIEVKDGKFEMPAGPVEISAEFEVDNPGTLDSVMVYVALAAISMVAVVVNTKYLKKAAIK